MKKIVLDHIKCFDVRNDEIELKDKNFCVSNVVHVEGSVRVFGIGKLLFDEGEAEVTTEQLQEIIHLISCTSALLEALRRATLKYLQSLL